MTKIVDLTKMIQYNKHDPMVMKVKLTPVTRTFGRFQIRMMGLPFRLFPTGFRGWTADFVKIGTHATTHIDAPYHYADLCEGKPAKTAEQIPLELCHGDGIVIDMSAKADNDPVTIDDIQRQLRKTGAEIKPNTIVLIRTDRDRLMGTKAYPNAGPGVSLEATEWLIDQGVRVMGTDQWGWDMPLAEQIRLAKKNNDRELFWNAHLLGSKKEYFHVEQLTNLAALPPFGFQVFLFPLKLRGASAAPVRAVAILND